MEYYLYLYKPTATNGYAPAVGEICGAICENSLEKWRRDSITDYMDYFDTMSVKRRIEDLLFDKCSIEVLYTPKEILQIPYIKIETSFDKVERALPFVYAVAAENDLVLFDRTQKRSFFRELVDRTFISSTLRENQLINDIKATISNVEEVRLVNRFRYERSFVIRLGKATETLEKRTHDCIACITHSKLDEETISFDNRCIVIKGRRYSFTFCIEGYCDDGIKECYSEGLGRKVRTVSCAETLENFKWLDNCPKRVREDIESMMNYREYTSQYPNPCERLSKCIEFTKELQNSKFDLRYSSFGYYGSEILFHLVPDDFYSDEEMISVLKIEEESASFILPIVEEFYPYLYVRYYLTENHISYQTMEDIVERLKEVRELILYDTYNKELEEYIDRFNLFVLSSDVGNLDFWECGDGYRIRNHPVEFLYNHRYDVVWLYDKFIEWAENQFKYGIDIDDRMFNIQGP